MKNTLRIECVEFWGDIKQEYGPLLAAFIFLLIVAFSILYSLNSTPFNEANESIIVCLEIFSATFAFIIFTLDRFGLLKNTPKEFRWLMNLITLAFFLITLPHLLADSAIKIVHYPLAFKIALTSPALILFSCVLYIFASTSKLSILIKITFSLITTALLICLLLLAIHYKYGDIHFFY